MELSRFMKREGCEDVTRVTVDFDRDGIFIFEM